MQSKNIIPKIGIGTWRLSDAEAQRSVEMGFEIGYRHVDTADRYGNHYGIKKAIENSGLVRKEIFLTSKIWVDDYNDKQKIIDSAKRFLDELGTEYLDLILLHWPTKNFNIEYLINSLADVKDLGLTKNIGVSNFQIRHLQPIIKSGIEIINNQIEIHPSLYDKALCNFCQDHNIVVTAYSPLAWGQDIKLKIIREIAQKNSITSAQVCISWLLQKGFVVIPRSTSKEHIQENYEAQNIKLKKDDIRKIDNLNLRNRLLGDDYIRTKDHDSPLDTYFDY